jgi:putative tryptophan/tyrosine transport system substrate-binding protein
MTINIERRKFIAALGGAAAAWPLAARAQQPAMPVIGFLSSRSPEESTHLLAAFRRGLAENGYAEGQNVTIEYRWALGQYDRLAALTAELVRRPVAVIIAVGGEPAARAAKAGTATIPIVATFSADPVASGLIVSLSRPGGNVTGVSNLSTAMEAKRFGLLRELVPQAAIVGVLLNPSFPLAASQLKDMQEAARALNLQLDVLQSSTDREIETAFESVAQHAIPALAVAADPFLLTRRDKLVTLAARHAVPTMYHFREFAVAGGLMSYGIDARVSYRQIGVYAGGILKGEKPAELPIIQPTKFELVINLKTAKALGLKVPLTLQVAADDVLE